VNSLNSYMMLFLLGLFFGVCLNFKLYFVCKKLGLDPPKPIMQFDQSRFFSYVKEMSKQPIYSELRTWVLLQNGLLIGMAILLVVILIKAS
jgi:hypothetical protein